MNVIRIRKFISIVLALVHIYGFSFGSQTIIINEAYASGLRSSYDTLKEDFPLYMQQFYDAGVTDADIIAFLADLDTEVARRGPLTDTNINNVLFNSMVSIMLTNQHGRIFDVLKDNYSGEIGSFLLTGEIPPSMLPLREAIRSSLLVSGAPTGGGGGGGGGGGAPQADPVADQVEQQLEAGVGDIHLAPSDGSNELNISGSVVQKIAAAGKALEISFPGVTMRFPPGALQIAAELNLSISVRPLTPAEASASESMQNISPDHQLVGNIYELNSSTESTIFGVKFGKSISVTFSYDGADLSHIDESFLDVYYYNETTGAWQKMNGTVDRINKTITFLTSHFSKYAIMYSSEQPPQKPPIFTDMAGHWAAGDVAHMFRLGLVSGVSPTEFAPNRTITRAEFAALLVRAVGLKGSSGTNYPRFSDVLPVAWYYGVVNAAAEAGLVSGYSASVFGPADPVTREQMAAMIVRALAYKGRGTSLSGEEQNSQLTGFTDSENISGWALQSVATAVKHGIVRGRSADTFAPKASATRAEAAVMILRTYNLF